MPRKVVQTPEEVADNLIYNPNTGILTYKSGKPAGWINNGYIRISKFQIYAHQIIIYKTKGYWPEEVDHKDHDGLNNRLDNLRPTDRVGNNRNFNVQKNNKIGIRHISLSKSGGYDVRIGKLFRAYTRDLELAKILAQEAREKYYGEFA